MKNQTGLLQSYFSLHMRKGSKVTAIFWIYSDSLIFLLIHSFLTKLSGTSMKEVIYHLPKIK